VTAGPRPLDQQTILVTGATDGLGRLLARDLAAAGAAVLIHGRDPGRVEDTRREIAHTTGNDRLATYVADFSDPADARRLADEVAAGNDRLDVLVNNAGLGAYPGGDNVREVNGRGHELHMAVNYLAPFVLTRRLVPLLGQSAPARIVNVASAGQSDVVFDDLMLERDYDGFEAYRRSKLALVMLTFDLADELRDRGVTATCLHPGTFMPTKMVLEVGLTPVASLDDGLRATRRLVVDADVEGVTGVYLDGVTEARAHRQAYDAAARRRLRELTEALTATDDAAA
jgi:NAD(P)-dependent dehydrogenase (short-subunit alcohol dehydrogenase family)